MAVPPAPDHESPNEFEDRAAVKAWRYSVFTAVERATRASPYSQRYGDIITAEPLVLEELRTTADIRRALQLEAFNENGEGVAGDRFTIEGTGGAVLVEGICVTVDQVAREEEQRVAQDHTPTQGRVHTTLPQSGLRLRLKEKEENEGPDDPWELDSMEILRAACGPHCPEDFWFGHASERLRDSEELATVAVAKSHHALQWASQRLRDSEALAKVAVSHNGLALQYASERLRDSEDPSRAACG